MVCKGQAESIDYLLLNIEVEIAAAFGLAMTGEGEYLPVTDAAGSEGDSRIDGSVMY